MTADLAIRHEAPRLVAEFERAEAAVRAHFAALHAAMARVNGAFGVGGEYGIGGLSIYPSRASHHYASFDADDVEHALMMLRRQAWDVLANRLEIRKAMSSTALAEFEGRAEQPRCEGERAGGRARTRARSRRPPMRFLRYLDGAEALVAPLLPRLDDAESEVLRLRAELADAMRERDIARKAITSRLRRHYSAREIREAKAAARDALGAGDDGAWG